MINTWFQSRCPNCHVANFVDNGDTQDLSVEDVSGVICWNCKAKYLLDPEFDDYDPNHIIYSRGVNLIEIKNDK